MLSWQSYQSPLITYGIHPGEDCRQTEPDTTLREPGWNSRRQEEHTKITTGHTNSYEDRRRKDSQEPEAGTDGASISSRDLRSSLKDGTLGRASSCTVPEVLVEIGEEKGRAWRTCTSPSHATVRAEHRRLETRMAVISTKAAGSLMCPGPSKA